MACPVVLLAGAGWAHRWVADDAFIHFRVVSQLLAGHGPVINAGERVEASTSPAWVALLTAGSVLPIARETLAVLLGLGLSLWALVAAQWGALALATPGRLRRVVLPVGALIIAALPPFWDFATSGLETGLEFAWLATVFWGTTRVIRRRADGTTGRIPAWLPVAAGFGVLIRPDLGLFCLAFVGIVLWLERSAGLRAALRTVLLAAAVPVAFEVFRMGYYGTILPNTALAKNATGSYWSQGWRYLVDFIAPYRLWWPVAVGLALTVSLILAFRRTIHHDAAVLVLVLLAASLIYVLYVVHLGGDFMHARMLLPAIFVICLPIAAVELSLAGLVAGVAVLGWAIPCALSFRTPYPLFDRIIDGQIGITNEASFYRAISHNSHPVTLADYRQSDLDLGGSKVNLVQHGRSVAEVAATRLRVLQGLGLLLPLAPDVRAPVVDAEDAYIGIIGYAAGTSAYVDDDLGLADPIASRLVVTHRSRPGHERHLPTVWMVARFAAPASWGTQNAVPTAAIQDAHTALHCGRLNQLLTAISGPMTPHRFVSNFAHSFAFTRLQVSPDPGAARQAFCK